MSLKTLVVDNFRGALTAYQFGDINSGRSDLSICSGQNPFVRPGSLTWNEAATQIDPTSSVITDLIMDGQERVESGILYVYAIGHTGRLYKIQVNDPVTYNPDYDNPVLLTTLTVGSPTFTRGGSIEFFGATEKIYIGHDKGVTTVDFNGTGEAALSATWTQTVPRPLRQFVGKLYAGNGSNIAEIDSTGTVTSSTKLSPGFPTNSQVRDIDFSTDGNYLEMVVSVLPLWDITSSVQQTVSTANSQSYVFKWNGVDIGYTTFDYFPGFSLSANTTFQNYQYVFGVDQFGTAIYNPEEKIMGAAEQPMVLPNAISSTGNILTYLAPLYYLGVLETDLYCWGHLDFEVGQPIGFWDLFFINATLPETDIVVVPWQLPVSNIGIGSSSNNYVGNAFGTSKVYFSTLETSSATTAYRLYKWRPNTSINITPGSPIVNAVYQTQTQMFSKKIAIKEIRIYGDPWVSGNSFQIGLTGPDRSLITNSEKIFTAGSNLEIGDDRVWYNPQMEPTYCLALQIVNLGDTNHVINKIEIDYNVGGE
jgi:hypothetical protein